MHKENFEKKMFMFKSPTITSMVPPIAILYNMENLSGKALAKTGAPMYGSPKYQFIDLNQKTYIYKLYLEGDKIYIGKTTNIKRRIEEHFTGGGSKVTQKFKPYTYEIIEVCDGFFSEQIEQYHTKEHIKTYGYENVQLENILIRKHWYKFHLLFKE